MSAIDPSVFEGAVFEGPGPDAVYRTFLADGKFKIQKCGGCGEHQFYPRLMCSQCGSVDVAWVTPSGKGEVYAVSVVNRRDEKGGPYNVAMVALAEGPKLMSRVDGIAHEDVKIGMAVAVRIACEDDVHFVVFDAA